MLRKRSGSEGEGFWPAYVDILMVTSFILILLLVGFALAHVDNRVTEEQRWRKARFVAAFHEAIGTDPGIQIHSPEGDRQILTFSDRLLFDLARADLKPEGQAALMRVAALLKAFDDEQVGFQRIKINGHTDPDPITTSDFPSNWHLSSARATSVLYFLANHEVPEANMSATGFAATQPADPEGHPLDKARMRRIEIELDYPADWVASMIRKYGAHRVAR